VAGDGGAGFWFARVFTWLGVLGAFVGSIVTLATVGAHQRAQIAGETLPTRSESLGYAKSQWLSLVLGPGVLALLGLACLFAIHFIAVLGGIPALGSGLLALLSLPFHIIAAVGVLSGLMFAFFSPLLIGIAVIERTNPIDTLRVFRSIVATRPLFLVVYALIISTVVFGVYWFATEKIIEPATQNVGAEISSWSARNDDGSWNSAAENKQALTAAGQEGAPWHSYIATPIWKVSMAIFLALILAYPASFWVQAGIYGYLGLRVENKKTEL
jgi:hypothetical protein